MRAWTIAATLASAGLWLAAGSAAATTQPEERFDEDLLLRPLPDGGIHAAFHFNIDSSSSSGSSSPWDDEQGDSNERLNNTEPSLSSWLRSATASESHFRLLPRSLIQIAQAANTREFKLSINAGSWQYAAWGEPTLNVIAPSSADAGASSSSSSSTHRSARSRLWGSSGRRSSSSSKGAPHETKLLGDDAVGNGAELWASFLPPRASALPGAEGPDARDHARLSWRQLTSALAGLFCASLDTTLSPQVALEPSDARLFALAGGPSAKEGATADEAVLFHAFAPSESICTENLTPFLKLLPCRSASAGLAQLLNPHAVFSSAYHGMSVHVTRLADGPGKGQQWKVDLRVQAVYTAAQARLRGRTTEELALRPLFNRNITQACPLATSSNVYVPRPPRATDFADEDDDDDSEQAPDEEILLLDADTSDAYQLPSWPRLSTLEPLTAGRLSLNQRSWRASEHSSAFSDVALSGLALAYDAAPALPAAAAPALEVFRTHTSAHPTRGTFALTLVNRHPTRPVRARYYDELPWWTKVWMHTLRAVRVEDLADCERVGGNCSLPVVAHSPRGRRGERRLSQSSPSSAGAQSGEIVRFVDDLLCPPILAVHYEPSAGRDLSPGAQPGSGRPTLLELDVRIPASSRVRLELEYDLAFLRYTEHPPGPQKGWGIPPGVLIVLNGGEGEGGGGGGAATTAAQGGAEGATRDAASRCPVEVPRTRPGVQHRLRAPSLAAVPPLPAPVGVAAQGGVRRRIYTEAALIELAVPDFSMIYNLILFTSTEIALFFGSIFNLLVRRFGDVAL